MQAIDVVPKIRPSECVPKELVTFLVGLVGRDGLVVGIDRRVLHASLDEVGEQVLETNEGRKFYDHGSLVCFYAGQDTAAQAARVITTQCQTDPNQSVFEWENTIDASARSIATPLTRPSDQIFVVRKDVADGF